MVLGYQPTSIEDAYDHAEQEYQFWEHELLEYGYDSDNAIAAAQYYGEMAALATIAYVEFDDRSMLDRLDQMRIRLYREDYE